MIYSILLAHLEQPQLADCICACCLGQIS